MNSNKLLIISVLLVFITASFSSCGSSSSSTDDAAAQEHFEEQEGEVDVLGFNPDSLRCEEGKVKSGQFFSTLLGSLGMTAQEAYNLTQVCDTLFDVRTLRVGNTYKAYFSAENTLEYLVYDREPEKKKYYFNNKILIRENC